MIGKERTCSADSSEQAVEGADMISLATSSYTPVFDGNLVKEGCMVSGVGSYLPNMREMDEKLLLRASKIYTDSTEAVLSEAGDFILPEQEHIFYADRIISGEIGQVVSGKIAGRSNAKEIIVFKSVGIGIQDLMAAKLVFEMAENNKIGKYIEL